MKELANMSGNLEEMLTNQTMVSRIKTSKPSADKVVAQCILGGLPIPCMSEALNFFNGMTTAQSTANLIQAQRDYFGAHTYQRIDDKSNKFYHTNWK
jgi:6-phosphogluconate dehydrogenase